jgi:hypothetical protein
MRFTILKLCVVSLSLTLAGCYHSTQPLFGHLYGSDKFPLHQAGEFFECFDYSPETGKLEDVAQTKFKITAIDAAPQKHRYHITWVDINRHDKKVTATFTKIDEKRYISVARDVDPNSVVYDDFRVDLLDVTPSHIEVRSHMKMMPSAQVQLAFETLVSKYKLEAYHRGPHNPRGFDGNIWDQEDFFRELINDVRLHEPVSRCIPVK